MTEREVLTEAAKRLGLLEYEEEGEISIDSYYPVRFTFNEDGNIVDINSHP